MSEYVISIIRTIVPLIVGTLLSKLIVLGLVFDDITSQALIQAITGLVIALYYAAARWLERSYPWVGVLLGYIRQPIYVDPTKTLPEQDGKVIAAAEKVSATPLDE